LRTTEFEKSTEETGGKKRILAPTSSRDIEAGVVRAVKEAAAVLRGGQDQGTFAER